MRGSSLQIKAATGTLVFLFLLFFTTACKKEKNGDELLKEKTTLQLTSEISSDTIGKYVTWLQGLGTRFALSGSRKNVAQSIKNKFTSLGYADVRIDSFWITKTYKSIYYQQWQYNVIATLPGSEISDSIAVLGGHYDDYLGTGDPFTIDPGANDNASGVASVLEIARVMKKNNYIPAKTIHFIAFGSEEMGLYGSNAYATTARTSLKRIRFMLNNDMVAYEPDTNPANWFVNIVDYNNSHFLRTEAEKLCTKYTLLKFVNDNTYYNASDSYSFFTNGFKALFFFSYKMDPNYHTLNDVVSNCNFRYCSEIVKLNCAILVDKN